MNPTYNITANLTQANSAISISGLSVTTTSLISTAILAGTAATIAVGTTTTLPAGSSATVTNVGTSGAATFNFGIPKGVDSAGDMLKATYDPTSKNADAFSQDNMATGTTNKNYTATEQTKLAAITGTNTGDQTTITGNAGTATALQTGRTIQTDLASTSAATFDGSANITPGVTGTLPLTNGGTGSTTKNFVDLTTAQTVAGVKTFSSTITSNIATGTSPLTVTSTTKVTNLNADQVDGFQASGTATANTILPLDSNALVPTAALGGIGTWNTTLLPFFPNSVTAGTWVNNPGNTPQYGTRVFQSNGVQNAQVDYKLFLSAGTYTFNVLTDTDVNRGIITILLNTVSVGTIDCYSATASANQNGTVTGIVVASSGVYTVSYKMATKNASSSGYYGSLSILSFVRTA